MQIGDTVRYTPQAIPEDKPTTGKITMIEPAGRIFNQPMCVIDTVDHWIPMYDVVAV